MTRVRVTVPATCSNLGPGLNSMALALGLHNVVELSDSDGGLEFKLYGEGVDSLPRDARNMVVQAAVTVFRQVGMVPAGLQVQLENDIPPGSGLGSSAAALLGGVVAANVLLGSPLDREEILRTAIELEGLPHAVLAALNGGLVISSYSDGRLVYTGSPVAPMYVAVALPQIVIRERAVLPQSVSLADATFNIGRAALVVQALANGDFDLLARSIQDRLHESIRAKSIPGYERAVKAARRHGAVGVTISGSGPALIAFAEAEHEQIAEAMARALSEAGGVPVRTWVLPIDTQGISISEMAVEMSFGGHQQRPIPASEVPAPIPPSKPVVASARQDRATLAINTGRGHNIVAAG